MKLGIVAAGVSALPALVQSNGVRQANNTAISVPISAATAGNLLVAVYAGLGAGGVNSANPTGFALTSRVSAIAGTNLASVRVATKIATGGETSVAWTPNTTTPTANNIEVMEFTKVTTEDKTTGADNQTTNTTGASGSTGALTSGTEVAIVGFVTVGNITGSETLDSGFTLVNHRSGTVNILVCGYAIVSGTTALNVTATWAPTHPWGAEIVTFS